MPRNKTKKRKNNRAKEPGKSPGNNQTPIDDDRDDETTANIENTDITTATIVKNNGAKRKRPKRKSPKSPRNNQTPIDDDRDDETTANIENTNITTVTTVKKESKNAPPPAEIPEAAKSPGPNKAITISKDEKLNETWMMENYPLHYCVWKKNYKELQNILSNNTKVDIHLRDPHNRTPLMLAVALFHKYAAMQLILSGASVLATDPYGFNVYHDAITTGDVELVLACHARRDQERKFEMVKLINEIFSNETFISEPDLYVEMEWNFKSWIPGIATKCPRDTYKIYKKGGKLRIDARVIDVEDTGAMPTWEWGNHSYIFTYNGKNSQMHVIDHDKQTFTNENYTNCATPKWSDETKTTKPAMKRIAAKVNKPIKISIISTKDVVIDRDKALITRKERVEVVESYECQVYGAKQIQVLLRVRMEHLKQRDNVDLNPNHLSWQEYFDAKGPKAKLDIGIVRKINVKKMDFKAFVWLTNNYPISLSSILPIVRLMACLNAAFEKLKIFYHLKFPSGFPVKIEIPIFYVLNATITFKNLFAISWVEGVQTQNSGKGCICESSLFDPPSGYQQV